MRDDDLAFVEYICRCGQRELVCLAPSGHWVRCLGPVEHGWEPRAGPYPADPNCVACHRPKRAAVRAFLPDPLGPPLPEPAIARRRRSSPLTGRPESPSETHPY